MWFPLHSREASQQYRDDLHILQSVIRSELFKSETNSCPTNPVRQRGQANCSHPSVTSTARVRTQPNPEIRAYPSDLSSRCRGLFQIIAKVRSFGVHLVTRCTLLASLLLLSLLPSCEMCSTLPPFQWFRSALHSFRCAQPNLTLVCFLFLFCTSDVGSIQLAVLL